MHRRHRAPQTGPPPPRAALVGPEAAAALTGGSFTNWGQVEAAVGKDNMEKIRASKDPAFKLYRREAKAAPPATPSAAPPAKTPAAHPATSPASAPASAPPAPPGPESKPKPAKRKSKGLFGCMSACASSPEVGARQPPRTPGVTPTVTPSTSAAELRGDAKKSGATGNGGKGDAAEGGGAGGAAQVVAAEGSGASGAAHVVPAEGGGASGGSPGLASHCLDISAGDISDHESGGHEGEEEGEGAEDEEAIEAKEAAAPSATNLNTCSLEHLRLLADEIDYFTEVKAAKLIGERDARGRFRDWDDVEKRLRGNGVGKAIIGRLRGHGCVVEDPAGADRGLALREGVEAARALAAGAGAEERQVIDRRGSVVLKAAAGEAAGEDAAPPDTEEGGTGEEAPAPAPGQRWYDTEEGRDAPFPPDLRVTDPKTGKGVTRVARARGGDFAEVFDLFVLRPRAGGGYVKCRPRTVNQTEDLIGEVRGAGGGWGEVVRRACEWVEDPGEVVTEGDVARWRAAYAIHEGPGKHPVEDETARSRATGSDENRRGCFDRLRATPGTLALEAAVRDLGMDVAETLKAYRVDWFGNVVSMHDGDSKAGLSLCMFDVDHIFPWRRGGRSSDDNFMALQCYANRSVKVAAALPVTVDEGGREGSFLRRMQCGLPPADLLDLLEEQNGRKKRAEAKDFKRGMRYHLMEKRTSLSTVEEIRGAFLSLAAYYLWVIDPKPANLAKAGVAGARGGA